MSPDLTKVNYHVSSALKKAVADGTIIQTKGKGASGSFKLAKVTQLLYSSFTLARPEALLCVVQIPAIFMNSWMKNVI